MLEDEGQFDHGMDDAPMFNFPNRAVRGLFGSSAVLAPQTELLKVMDIVRIGSGQEIIITEVNPHKPKNLYSGVLTKGQGNLTKGQGKQYVFGPKHNPRKIGVAAENHPALRALDGRKAEKGGHREVVQSLMELVDAGDLTKAKQTVAILRTLGF